GRGTRPAGGRGRRSHEEAADLMATRVPGISAPRRRVVPGWAVALVVVAALLAGVGALLSVRALTGGDEPGARRGLRRDGRAGRPGASSEPVAGASGYQRARDDALVVYRGDETAAGAVPDPAGEHPYRVVPLRGDASSRRSEPN